jgi:uncharacterized membrane protein YqaE (UPF0057 family)
MTSGYNGWPILLALIFTVLTTVYLYDLSLRIVLAVIAPPLVVFLRVGLTKHFWLNILLTILGYLPGSVHAVWVIQMFPSRS